MERRSPSKVFTGASHPHHYTPDTDATEHNDALASGKSCTPVRSFCYIVMLLIILGGTTSNGYVSSTVKRGGSSSNPLTYQSAAAAAAALAV